jgi:hypothetical protein
MRSLLFKAAVALLTFMLGVVCVAFVYLLDLDSNTKRAIPAVVPYVIEIDYGFSPCDFNPDRVTPVTEKQAVLIAECFVIDNGYTDLPPSTDPSKIIPENIYPLTDEFGMKLRHNSLERKADSIYRAPESWGGVWEVTFKVNPSRVDFALPQEFEFGRMVTMDFYGTNVQIRHSPQPLRPLGFRWVD